MIFSPAYAQAAGGGAGGANLFELLMPFFLILIIMYFLVIRPQQKRFKEHQEMIGGLRRGDEIITAGGMIGKISKVKEGDEEVEVEIAQGVKVRVVKSTVTGVTSKTEPAKASPANDQKAAKK